MERIIELGGIVTGFNVTEHCIDCICRKDLLKIDKDSRDIICQRTVFEKEGLSRKLIADDEHIYIYDFCTLYTLEKIKVIHTPLKLSGCTHIENNFMYISSRNILGIKRIQLNQADNFQFIE